MKKTPDPVEVVGDKIVPAAEDLLHAAADKLGPLAEAAADAIGHAADRVSPLAHSAAEKVGPLAQSAADQVGPLAHSAAEKLSPLAHSAADKGGELAHQAADFVSPYAHQAADAVTPYVHQAANAFVPFAHQAVDTVSPAAHQAADTVAPYAALAKERGLKAGHDVADRLAPVVGSARDKLTGDVLPKVGAAVSAAAAPLVTEATTRGKAVVEAARGDTVVVAAAPPKKKGKVLLVVAGVAAAAAGAYVLARKLIGDKGSEWQTARPSTPYVPPTPAATSSSAAPTPAATTDAKAEDDTQIPGSAHDAYRAADGAAEPDQPAEGGDTSADAGTATEEDPTDRSAETDLADTLDHVADVDSGVAPLPEPDEADSLPDTSGDTVDEAQGLDEGDSAAGTDSVSDSDAAAGDKDEVEDAVPLEADTLAGVGPDTHPDRYSGPGAYVGVEPPEGFTIKGNERSMKYHVPDSGGYNRTIAEVWFSSEEAAQAAGFVRAQR